MHLPQPPAPSAEERFAAAHSACHDVVYRYLARRIIPAHLAEDLTGEVFLCQADAMAKLAPDLTARTLRQPRRETAR